MKRYLPHQKRKSGEVETESQKQEDRQQLRNFCKEREPHKQHWVRFELTHVLWDRREINPEEDCVDAHIRHVGDPVHGGHHRLVVPFLWIWASPGKPLVRQEHDDELLYEVRDLLHGVEDTLLATVTYGLELRQAPKCKEIRSADECHGTAKRSGVDLRVIQDLLPRFLLPCAKPPLLQEGRSQPTHRNGDGQANRATENAHDRVRAAQTGKTSTSRAGVAAGAATKMLREFWKVVRSDSLSPRSMICWNAVVMRAEAGIATASSLANKWS